MVALTLTAKNQLTLRKEVVKHLGLKPGDKVEANLRPDGRVELVAPRPRTGKISDLAGMLKRPGQPVLTIEDMNEAIAEAGAEAGMRGL
ncbi:MAG: AbrB/MazE/SpoVT family DNA-binding domain-containing protein [Brevundimonas sp.]|nr:AbrB/MazE/SpoVT family DNA-binding domain-containing protein [Brevundimonas sp.]